jgi:uncharacterized membrane protein YdjX (TVP38/TMEM64 family)
VAAIPISTRFKGSKHVAWLLVGGVIAAAVLGVSLLPIEQWVQAFRAWIQGLGAVGFLAFGAAYILAAVLLLPVWPLSITGGLAFGIWGFVLVPISATLGSVAAFLISRYFARAKIQEWLARQPRYRAVDEVVEEEGWKVVILLRLSPLVPYNLMNYFCGITGVSLAGYLGATLFGTAPVTAMYVYLGLVGQAVASGTMSWPQWALLAIGVLATAGVTILVTRKVRPKLKEASARGSGPEDGGGSPPIAERIGC